MVTEILLDHHNVVYDNEHGILYIPDMEVERKHCNTDDYMLRIVWAYDMQQQQNYDLYIQLFLLYDDLDPKKQVERD